MGLHRDDRLEPIPRDVARPMQLGDDVAIIGEDEAGDDAHAGLVEPGADHRGTQRLLDGPDDGVGDRAGVVGAQDVHDGLGQPPRVRLGDQRRQVLHPRIVARPPRRHGSALDLLPRRRIPVDEHRGNGMWAISTGP